MAGSDLDADAPPVLPWRKEAGWLRYGTAAAGWLCVETATGYGRRQVGVAAWPAGEDVTQRGTARRILTCVPASCVRQMAFSRKATDYGPRDLAFASEVVGCLARYADPSSRLLPRCTRPRRLETLMTAVREPR